MTLPTGIRIVGNKCQMSIRRPDRKRPWDWEATGLDKSQVAVAAMLREKTQALIDSGRKDAARPGFGTVGAFAEKWLAARENLSADDDKARLRKHVIAHVFESGRKLSTMTMDEVRPMHARAIMKAVGKKDLARRTVLNVHSIAKQMFDDAVADEVIKHSPWVVPRKELPKKRDKDPKFRALAIFEKPETFDLLFDERVPWDRRVLYALEYLGAMRFGEAAARRWEDRIRVAGFRALHLHGSFSTKRRAVGKTKTLSTRAMPEHPTLSIILDHWFAVGFKEFFGRDPLPGDIIVPSRMGVHRSKNHSLHKLHEDLERLDYRPRRQHDLRRSFVSHAVDDGADRDRLNFVTHGRGMSVMEGYDTADWKVCREHVLRLKFDPPEAMGKVWGDEAKMREMDETSTNRSGGAGNRIRSPLRDGSGIDHAKSGKSTRDYRRRSPLFRPVQVAGIPNVPTAAAVLLEACDGDVDAAISALRSATKKRRTS